jgi:hypothetical protein
VKGLTGFQKVVFWLNTAGFLAWIFWLVFRSERVFYTQEGVIAFLPCLPIFFVYFYLFQKKESP